MKAKPNNLWTDNELQKAIEAYLYILQLEHRKIKYSLSELTSFLLKNSLKTRNDASLRYRMRNISWVFHQNNLPTISAFSPAPQVGSGVQARIEKILRSYLASDRFSFLKEKRLSPNKQEPKRHAQNQLEKLLKALEEVETPSVGIGHNRPPDESISALDISEIKQDIKALQKELNKLNFKAETVEKEKNKLITFGLKVATWIGGRATKFTDVVLASFATIAIAKVTHVLPVLMDAIDAIGRLIP